MPVDLWDKSPVRYQEESLAKTRKQTATVLRNDDAFLNLIPTPNDFFILYSCLFRICAP
jgi:hypothetical protein